MELNEMNKERRKHNRKKVKFTALLKMGIHLNGRGYARDVSEIGLCLVAPGIFQHIRSTQLNNYLGAHVSVMFPAQSLTVNGTIVRIDTAKGEGGVHVTSTSNDSAWEKLNQE
jgi:hypothetical protein